MQNSLKNGARNHRKNICFGLLKENGGYLQQSFQTVPSGAPRGLNNSHRWLDAYDELILIVFITARMRKAL